MNKQELINTVVNDTNLTKKTVNECIDSLIKAIKEQVKDGNSITLVGFGTFGSKTRKARTGRNPRTGEEIQIPQQEVPYFNATATFKDSVAGK